jgi:hypothetical protein
MKNLFIFILLFIATVGYSQTSTKEHCSALTTKGLPCKNFAVVGEKTCKLHSSNTPRCGHTTTKGQPCKMIVSKAGELCWRHKQ